MSSYEKDLFISYAHIDDQPLSQEQLGWVTQFHRDLESLLRMRIGKTVSVWRDNKLQGNDVFSDEIVQKFPDTAIFVSVLTPRYIESEWCTREVREFCEVAKQRGGLVVDNKTRVFKVIKTPVDSQEPLPPEIRKTLGYEFYIYDEYENPLELDRAFGLESDYLRKLNSLAWDIAKLLKQINKNGNAASQAASVRAVAAGPAPAAAPSEKDAEAAPVVYLAECSYDRREDREVVAGDLKAHGYTVLPGHRLPSVEGEYIAEVKALLARCQLSIHLIGQSYGSVPDGPSRKSGVILQNELAVAQSVLTAGQKGVVLKRVIWLPEGLQSNQPQQQQFIEAVTREAKVQHGAEVITGSMEDLKAAIHTCLQPEPEEPEPSPQTAGGRKKVYLIFDQRDRRGTRDLRRFLMSQGFEVLIPLFEGDSETVRNAHKDHLANCNAVLLYYGEGDEAWKYTRDRDLNKIPAYRSGKPLPLIYTFVAGPVTEAKEDLIDFGESPLIIGERQLINAIDGFDPEEMNGFVQAFSQSRPAS